MRQSETINKTLPDFTESLEDFMETEKLLFQLKEYYDDEGSIFQYVCVHNPTIAKAICDEYDLPKEFVFDPESIHSSPYCIAVRHSLELATYFRDKYDIKAEEVVESMMNEDLYLGTDVYEFFDCPKEHEEYNDALDALSTERFEMDKHPERRTKLYQYHFKIYRNYFTKEQLEKNLRELYPGYFALIH